jgi:hypothetical protein
MRGREVIGGLVLLVVAAMMVAGCGGISRAPTDPVSRAAADRARENAYVAEAVRATRQLPGCEHLGISELELSTGGGVTTSPPDRALLAVLAALHKPAVSADSLPRTIVGWGHRREYGRFIRLAATVDGWAYYVIPTASPFRDWRLAPSCLTVLSAKAHAEAPQIPASMRASTLALVAREIASYRAGLRREIGKGVCLASEGGTVCGATASDIRNWGLVAEYGQMVGLVPNGVASVTIHIPASGKPAILPTNITNSTSYRPASTDTFGVTDNVFVTNIAEDLRPFSGTTITWRSASGRIIKTVPAEVAGIETPAWS